MRYRNLVQINVGRGFTLWHRDQFVFELCFWRQICLLEDEFSPLAKTWRENLSFPEISVGLSSAEKNPPFSFLSFAEKKKEKRKKALSVVAALFIFRRKNHRRKTSPHARLSWTSANSANSGWINVRFSRANLANHFNHFFFQFLHGKVEIQQLWKAELEKGFVV